MARAPGPRGGAAPPRARPPRGHLQRGLAEAVVEQLHVALLLLQLLLQLRDPRLQTPLLIQQRRPGRAEEETAQHWGRVAPRNTRGGCPPHPPAAFLIVRVLWLPSPSLSASPASDTSTPATLARAPVPSRWTAVVTFQRARRAAGVPFRKGKMTLARPSLDGAGFPAHCDKMPHPHQDLPQGAESTVKKREKSGTS